MLRRPPRTTRTYTLFPYTTRFLSRRLLADVVLDRGLVADLFQSLVEKRLRDELGHMDLLRLAGRDRLAAEHVMDQELPRGFHRDFHNCSPWRGGPKTPSRSEEQTSELQSLMRISYAVFCLKKK